MNLPAIRNAATAFALVAMVLRALLPAGWMPAATGAHGATLVICTMNGPKRIALPDTPVKKQPQQPQDHTSGPCPFGVAAIAFAPPAPVAFYVPLTPVSFAAHIALAERIRAQAPSTANGPRAPPLFV